ncbi:MULTISPECIES: hypothetical protein [unclassified Actinoplanes]|uniref:hypothetical protein n=1 Tax=unclassified Actinoplanes TaxID=2626549 RepID=UPI0002E00C53|nr:MULTISPECIES: hypothetical protein [unclassified Actinoplanes]
MTATAVTLFASAAVAAIVLSAFDRHSAPPALTPAAQPHAGFGPRPESWPASADPRAELDFTRRDDLATLTLSGQFAAELAATTGDPAVVLAEHQRLRRTLASSDHPVILLHTADLDHPRGAPGRWLTLAVGDFPDATAVTTWCHTVAATHCTPRRLLRPR